MKSEATYQLDPDVTKGPHLYVSSSRFDCHFGRSVVYAHPNPIILKQIQRNTKQKIESSRLVHLC